MIARIRNWFGDRFFDLSMNLYTYPQYEPWNQLEETCCNFDGTGCLCGEEN